ncbi:MAG: c-type cytochrome biogenesis protein CcsB [Thermodesulfovibrionales bacterium]|nr:c-type cytochrome biogenesis protein CcsB [Thermodesulfovibrionales bacterium]
MDSSLFFGISTIAYMIAMVTYITYLAFKQNFIGQIATTLTLLGFLSHTVAFGLRWKEFNDLMQMGLLRSIPLTNLYESLIFFIWCTILAYLIIEFKYKNKSFGAFVTPIAGIALAFIDISGMSKDIHPLIPALQSNWLLAHVTLSFIAYATFAISFATALIYLILTTDNRRSGAYIFWTITVGLFTIILIALAVDYIVFKAIPAGKESLTKGLLLKATFRNESKLVVALSIIFSLLIIFSVWRFGYILKKLIQSFSLNDSFVDELTYKNIAIGFPVFTLGGLIFGAIWADQAWGRYWSWDPKETWSLITWFVYAFYLHARLLRGWRGKKIAIVAVIGFFSTIFTYLGVNLLLSGLHAYGGI